MKFIVLMLGLIYLNTVTAAENDLYDFHWLDPDKAVYVLQKKIHTKKDKNYFQLGYTQALSTEFQDSYGLNIGFGRYFHEEFAIEMQIMQFTNENSSSYESIVRVNNTEPFIRRNLSSIGIMGVWSPFYGKINTFNRIFYFDVAFGLGISKLTTETNLNYLQQSTITNKFDKEDFTSISTKAEIKFYYDKNFYIHGQIFNHNYQANEPQNKSEKKLKFTFESTVGVGYAF